jgi:hypothetical protein
MVCGCRSAEVEERLHSGATRREKKECVRETSTRSELWKTGVISRVTQEEISATTKRVDREIKIKETKRETKQEKKRSSA